MNERSRWIKIAMGVFSAIGVIAIFTAGVLGARVLVRSARGNPPANEAASIGAPEPPDKPAPPPANALPPPPGTVLRPPRVIPPDSQPPTPSPAGISDLAAEIVDTGILAGGPSGTFKSAPSIRPDDYPAIVFDVVNIGTAVSERWEFSATLPTLGGFFKSETQPPLAPGDRIRFTLGFRPVGAPSGPGGAAAVITVDPLNRLIDRNRKNDSATLTFTVMP